MDTNLIVIAVAVLLALSGYLSDREDIIGFIANLFWYLWRKLWIFFLIILAITLLFGGLPQACA